jgi:hypothetical protein
MNKPVYDPHEAGNKLTIAPWIIPGNSEQIVLFHDQGDKGKGAVQ